MKRKLWKWLIIIPCIWFLFFLLMDFISPLHIRINYSTTIESDEGELLYSFLSSDDKWRMKSSLEEISPELKKALLFKEDKYFNYHFGINPVAIIRAAFNNLFYHKRTSGASTITMQVTRLLQPKDRTVVNKLIEMFRATQLELHYSKDEILSMYLNLAPYGGNIEGVKAASWLYFGKNPLQLSLAQAVTLTIIPNRPTSLNPGKNDNYLQQERNRWLKRMMAEKIFNQQELTDALNEPVVMKRRSLPGIAPHLSIRLHLSQPNNAVIKTTINKNVQNKLEQLAWNYHQRMQMHNVNNLSVLVVNNATHNIVGYVGNADFSDYTHNGQVDGITAVRSPGSTLKPLVYALAMDKGIITPKTVLYDVPINYSGYSPENYNEQYNGKVTAEKALAYSLNIPAVYLLNELNVKSLTEKLKQSGFSSITQKENQLGLSAVLGGCGVKSEELAGLFCTYANKGMYQPLHFMNDNKIKATRLISEASAFMITDILTQLQRPDLPNNSQSSTHVPKVAWKTGTSYGRKDAWSVGYNKKYTVLVWAGNFDNTGVAELSGAEMATPLLFDVFNSIDYTSSNEWFTAPATIDLRYVCNETGKVPGDFCTDRAMDYFIPNVSDQQPCTHLQQVAVSPDEKFSYCTNCIPSAGYKKVFYPNLAPELMSFYQSEHIPYREVPTHNPLCTRIFNGDQPKILSPVNGQEYLIEKEFPEKIQLSCASANDVQFVYWYVNDTYYMKCKSNEKIFFTPKPGDLKISCADDKGRNTDVRIKVSVM